MDPITALSIAGSVITIVDFGGRLFALTTRTLRDGGVIEDNVDLELITADLQAAAERLLKGAALRPSISRAKPLTLGEAQNTKRNGTSSSNRPNDQQTPDERLCALASRSYDLSTRLSKILEEIKSKGNGKYRTSNAVRQSLHTMVKKDEVEECLKRLEPLRGELTMNLVEVMRCVEDFPKNTLKSGDSWLTMSIGTNSQVSTLGFMISCVRAPRYRSTMSMHYAR
jgi:hypothetical protein